MKLKTINFFSKINNHMYLGTYISTHYTLTIGDDKAYFEKNSLKYDTFPSAQADIAIVKIEPSSEDKAKAKA